MKKKNIRIPEQALEYQPDAVEIEERSVPGKIRWVLYLILGSLVALVAGAIVFKVDRIVTAEGKLITTSPTIVIQSLNTAVIRSVKVQVGDVVEKGQLLATLDPTFAGADLNRLRKQQMTLQTQIRRIQAELQNKPFAALPEEGEEGKLQEHLYRQRKTIVERTRKMSEDKKAALVAKRALNHVQLKGKEKQLKLLRDVEGTTARLPQKGPEYRLQLMEAQKKRYLTADEIESLKAEDQVLLNELSQVESEWQHFLEERMGESMEQEVQLLGELEKTTEEITKASRLHELVSLHAPRQGIVLNIADRSVGSILQQAEPFITLVPLDSIIEAEVNIQSKDIARIRVGDTVRIKLDAFPFQRHGTLKGEVRVISGDSFQQSAPALLKKDNPSNQGGSAAFYRTRIRLLSHKLRNVPEGFQLLPGMKVRAEIKVGKRRVISYFLYPIIRALDESLREP